ncbi:MAG: type 1 glutamine amidotransferase [Ignavibacteriae bacterium]|nr:MAG: type 1 glutamine amidotransferase [Ignavibacteriota bacterium]
MNVHYFQHVPYEGLGSLEPWLKSASARITATKFYENTYLPNIRDIDWLIVMGGPMSVNDERRYPWLAAEKKFIADAIANGKIVFGVCLGAQLIARALGARVYPNRHREIGWLPVEGVAPGKTSALGTLIPSPMNAFHWHGETFDLPEHAIHLARSEGCEHQAFCIGDRVLGLQFHLEATPVMVRLLLDQCPDDLIPGPYVQNGEEMLSNPSRFQSINAVMDAILEYWNGPGSR